MTRYGREPLDFRELRTIPIAARGGKVTVDHFAKAPRPGMTVGAWLDALPRILAADSLRALVRRMRAARERDKPVIWGIGGHIIKCGLAPVLIELMRRGYATAFAMNGAAAIHDFEIAIAGQTSEDVEAALPDGSFGSAEETGREMNLAYRGAARDGVGAGEALGRSLDERLRPEFAPASVLLNAWRASVPVTVHIAVGTDTPHTHPTVDAAALGAATHHDFRLLCALVRELNEGGVYINAGSAVVLPEVFLKAVSAVRNLDYPLREFTTANLDFIQHYRPTVNVVSRPHAQTGGQGIAITGHHEIMVPLLAAVLLDAEAR